MTGQQSNEVASYLLKAGDCPYQSPMSGGAYAVVLESGDIGLYCGSCNTAWASYDQFTKGEGVGLDSPGAEIGSGLHMRKGTWRFATAEDVMSLRYRWDIVPTWYGNDAG